MTFVEEYRSQLLDAIGSIDLAKVDQAIAWFADARDNKRQVFVCGNGGSGTTANHIACDVLKGASYGKSSRFRIISLSDAGATISAYSNDVSHDCIFEEQLRNFAHPGDVVLALSGSGNSENVVRAVQFANSAGCRTIALTGRGGGRLGPLAHLEIRVDGEHMGRIEDVHLMICHMIAYRFIES